MTDNTRYNVFCKGRKIYSELDQNSFFDVMEDLAQSFYENGSPDPVEITTEIIGDTEWQNQKSD